MEDKIIEVFKKYSKSVDMKSFVYKHLIEKDWSDIENEVEDVVKLFRQTAIMTSSPNGERVLAALKELSDCFTDEERKTMFGDEK